MLSSYLSTKLSRKVPEVLIYFWIIKLLTTGMGETTSDFLVRSIDPVIAVLIGGVGLGIALTLQISTRKYVPWIYWLAVTMVAIFGTMAADILHIGLGIPYIVSTIFFAICLIIVFTTWYKTEKTLSIHSIYTRKRELFYWATVLTTFALGTALGDMTASTLQLGYLNSGILFSVLFAIPLIAWKFSLPEVIAFWMAYIVTRPLGASFADWIGRPTELSGLGFGTGQISLVLTAFIFILVAFLSITHSDDTINK
jgi:uncharacterized membrane-anchored protein